VVIASLSLPPGDELRWREYADELVHVSEPSGQEGDLLLEVGGERVRLRRGANAFTQVTA